MLRLRLISRQPGPRFLGLRTPERNARVARRCAEVSTSEADATLTVPAATAITPALFAALPQAAGAYRLAWDPARPPIEWTVPGGGPAPPTDVRVPDGAALDVSTPAARWRSSWRLLRASGKPKDGWLARYLHRKISRACSYVLLQLGLGPAHASFLTLLIGAAGAYYLAQTTHATMIGGTLLLWAASIADGIDGEMARLTFSESDRGEQLDTAVDFATYLLADAAVLIGCWRQGIGALDWAVVIAASAGLPLVLMLAFHLVREAHGGTGPLFGDAKAIEIGIARAAADSGSIVLRAISSAWVLLRREMVALVFFLISLPTGARIVYPRLLACALVAVTVILLVDRGVIEDGIRAAEGLDSRRTPNG